jgi:hypothetical protein
LLVCGLLLVAAPLHAEPVTLKLFGSLDFVDATVDHALSVGDPFEFTLSYDTAAPTSSAGPFTHYSTGTISWSIAGYPVGGPSGFPVAPGLQSCLVCDTRIYFELDSGLGGVPIGLPIPGSLGLRALFFFYDDAATPAGQLPLNVNPGASMSFSLYYSPLDAGGRVGPAGLSSTGTTSSIHRVPEPATSLLFGTGVVLFAGRRLIRARRAARATRA